MEASSDRPCHTPPETSIEVEVVASTRIPYEVGGVEVEDSTPLQPTSSAATAPTTPYDRYYEQLRAFQRVSGLVGAVRIRGLPIYGGGTESDDDDSNDPARDDGAAVWDSSRYTEDDVQSLRYVMLDARRSAFLDRMEGFVLYGEEGHPVGKEGAVVLGSACGRRVCDSFFDDFRPRYDALECPATQFDVLFAYTFHLMEYNAWMYDGDADNDSTADMAAELATLWKALLREADATLGIDGEYTRPAVLVFLDDVQQELTAAGGDPPISFQFE